MIPYSHQHIDKSDIEEVMKALSSDWITQGPCVAAFEEALCKYTGAKYAVALSSGTAALHLSMLVLGIGQGDRVITSPITFSASANCAVYVGARPDFVDIDDMTYHMDIEKLDSLLKSRTKRKNIKAIIPVHFMGTVSDIIRINDICAKYGISIIEDAAHALGAEYSLGQQNLRVGNSRHSDITIFSFHPIKHITTGEGGAILTNDKKIRDAARTLRHHGIVKRNRLFWHYDIPRIGFNYRITDFQCALGISQLNKLDKMVRMRRELVRRYNEGLCNIEGVRLPYEREDSRASYHLYAIRVPKARRDKLYLYLKRKGISTQVNYIPVHQLSYYKKTFGYKQNDFPVAERYSKECLSLPLYTGFKRGDQDLVINSIKEFFKR